VNKYVTAVELALKEGERELALKLAQEGIQYHEIKAIRERDNGTLGFLVPLCELIGDYRRAQDYCEKLHRYEQGGDLALKLGEPDEARRWWSRQIELNESQNPGSFYYGKNVFLAKKIGDEDRAQEFYLRLVRDVEKIKNNSAWDAHVAEEMGDTERAVRWYAAVGWLGNAARVAFQAGQSYRWIMEKIVKDFDEQGTSREVRVPEWGGFIYRTVEVNTTEQVEAGKEFWNQLLATATSYYRNRGWSGTSFFAGQDNYSHNKYIILKRLKMQPETFIPPGKANVYLTLKKWLEEKRDRE